MTAFKLQLVGTDRRRRTGTPSILETECIHHFYTGNSMFGTTKEGRLLAGPGLGAREARRRRRLLLGRGLRGRGRRERLAGRGPLRALLRRRRGLVVDGEGAAPAQEGLEAVLPDGALGRVEAERGFRGRRVGAVLEDGPALDDGALLVVRVHDLCENRYAIEQTQSRGVEKFDFHAVTTVRGEEICWRESWGRCILFERRKAWPARREKGLRPASRSSLAVVE